MMLFNINNYVWVKLTAHGKRLLLEQYEREMTESPYLRGKLNLPEEDADGWSRWQLWGLMSDLGKHCVMGFEPPFETTIRIEPRKVDLA